ncbi:ejaculatory bulb-specific protein 3-like [Maniola jurtina]|uniref:ejaculatory bulb-specific protein 3-like n=1 Tax=Maniola jurtina TaxID=191418 RepID=UPI001E688246|nr:ejaculatory bulb-specific protein 3-like [Maniola jurtina]XP_045777512.1 ejaculatory bulb-specific protein 3-like [Maniola jurtina]
MNTFLSCLLLLYVIYHCHCENNTYTNKYDGIDLDQILSSDRLLDGYVNCLLDKGPCTPDGKELKQNLPDAIQDDCSKCTEKQREGADKVMHYVIDHRPEDWKRLEEKYNSDGTYKLKYLTTKEPADKPASKEDTSESGSYDDDADDEDDENNKDHYTKKDVTK